MGIVRALAFLHLPRSPDRCKWKIASLPSLLAAAAPVAHLVAAGAARWAAGRVLVFGAGLGCLPDRLSA